MNFFRTKLLEQNPNHENYSFDVECLEDRLMLSTVDIIAAGTTGEEQIQLKVNGATVRTWDDIGDGAQTGTFVVQSYTTTSTVTADQIRIQFTNDLYRPAQNIDRNVRIDAIVIDGIRFESESSSVYSTGTWTPSDGIQSGYHQSDYLHGNGYFQYSDSAQTGSVIQIRARGHEGGEQFNLSIAGQVVGTWETTTQYQDFQYQADREVAASEVRVDFINDLWQPGVIDRNLVVDYLDIDGVVYQTEDPTVYSSGVWVPGDGVGEGFLQSEQLHVNGYFQYDYQPSSDETDPPDESEFADYVDSLNDVLPDGWNTQIVDNGTDIRMMISNQVGGTEYDIRLGSAGVISDFVDDDTGQDLLAPAFQGENTDRVAQWTLWETGTRVVNDIPSLPAFEHRFNITQAGTFEDTLSDTVAVEFDSANGYVDVWAIADDQWKSEQDPYIDGTLYSMTRIQALDQGGLLVRRVVQIGEIKLNGQTTTLERAYLEAWTPFSDQAFNSLALSIDDQGIPNHWYADSINIPHYPATDVVDTRGWAVVYDRFQLSDGDAIAVVFGTKRGDVHLADGTTQPTQDYVLNSMDFNGGLAVLPGLIPGELPAGSIIDTSMVLLPSEGLYAASTLDALAAQISAPVVYHPGSELPDDLSNIADNFQSLSDDPRVATDHLSDLT